MIRKAVSSDLDQIMKIVRNTIIEMHSYGNFQWNDDYPKKEDFIRDISEGTLFIYDKNGIIGGFICINRDEPDEYKNANWSTIEKAFVIHRLAVNTDFRSEGIGVKLVTHADIICRENNLSYIRTDTNSLNIKAQRLLKKCGYTFTGEINLLGKENSFYCYDKIKGV